MIVVHIIAMFRQLLNVYRFPMFHQTENSNCGIECLRMVLAFNKLPHSMESVAAQFATDKFGTNFAAIQVAAENLGLDCLAAKLSVSDLWQIPLPAIAHWNQDHFVVLYKIDKDGYLIGDPAKSLMKVSEKEFTEACCIDNKLQSVKLNVMVFEKSHKYVEPEKLNSTTNHSISFQKIISVIIGATSLLFILWNLFLFPDKALYQNHWILLVMSFCFFLGSIISLKIFNQSHNSELSLAKLGIIEDSKQEDLVSDKVYQVLHEYIVKSYLLKNVQKFWISWIVSLAVLAMIATISIYALCFSATLILIYVFILWYFFEINENQNAQNIAGFSNMQIELTNLLKQNIEFGKVGKHNAAEYQLNSNSIQFTVNQMRREVILVAVLLILSFMTLVLMYDESFFGIKQLIWISAGIAVLLFCFESVLRFLWHQKKFNNDLFHQDTSIHSIKQSDTSKSQNFNYNIKDIRIEHLNYSYPSGNYNFQLRDINLTIKQGAKVAITGGENSGKSTLINLLAGHLTNYSGKILFGEIAISELHRTELSQNFGICTDSSDLLPGTIAWNITLESKLTNQKRLNDILEACFLQKYVLKMPQGLETFIDPNNIRISDVLRIKIVLARLLYQNKEIMLIDMDDRYTDLIENLSLLESVIQYAKDKTIIFSTTQKEVIQIADKVLYLKEGQQIAYIDSVSFLSQELATNHH